MGNLIENLTIKKNNPKDRVFSHEPYAQELYDRYEAYFEGRPQPVAKDMEVGQIYKAVVYKIDSDTVIVSAESSATIYLDYIKESKFLEKIGHTAIVPGMEVDVMLDDVHRGSYYGSVEKAYIINLKRDLLESIKTGTTAYKGKIKSINDGGFMVDVAGLDCFMPGSLAAANKVTNFESMIGRELMVMVETYLKSSGMFVVSNKKYIQTVIPTKIKEIDLCAEYTGTITGSVAYGIFIEWDEMFTGLLHEPDITVEDWKSLKSGSPISFYIKEIRENIGKDSRESYRIILSQKGPSPEIVALKEFKERFENEVVSGVIKDVKPFGAFVDIKGYVGMLPIKDIKKSKIRLKIGDFVDVIVTNVDIFSKKIKIKLDEE